MGVVDVNIKDGGVVASGIIGTVKVLPSTFTKISTPAGCIWTT